MLGGLNIAWFTYTHAGGAGTHTIDLVTLPAGKIRVMSSLSYISMSQMVTSADAHLGHRAYTQPDGTAVAEDDNEWVDNSDVGGAARAGAWSNQIGTAVNGAVNLADTEYETQEGLKIFVTIDTANIEDTDTIDGYVVYMMHN